MNGTHKVTLLPVVSAESEPTLDLVRLVFYYMKSSHLGRDIKSHETRE